MRIKTTNQLLEVIEEATRAIDKIDQIGIDSSFARFFPEAYQQALLNAGIGQMKADEALGIMRHYLDQITAGLSNARYMLQEMSGELIQNQRTVTAEQRNTFAGFQV